MLNKTFRHRTAALAMAAALAGSLTGGAQAAPGPRPAGVAQLAPGTQRPTRQVLLSVGQGELINLPTGVANVWTSNASVADVYVSNPRQIHLFGKAFGEATVFATTASGDVVYSTNVRVSQNITSIDEMVELAMPGSDIRVTTAGQIAVLTGTVASPADSAQAEQLVLALLNPGQKLNGDDPLKIGVINRLRTATPLQVNLQVRIAEVSRDLAKQIGVNLLSKDTTGGFLFGIAQGRSVGSIGTTPLAGLPQLDASSLYGLPSGSIKLPFDPVTGRFVLSPGTSYDLKDLGQGAGKTNLGFAGRLLGLDVLAALDLAENQGMVTTLANPNLTALSGETASFLAGGEIPIPISQGLGAVSVDYKQYGVSLAFTPTVLADGRISMRVRPEVSQLTQAGSVTVNGFTVPGISTRRAETTVELGSGQSFMIGGLLNNSQNNTIDKAPFLGDLPVLGALFRSNNWRHQQTELVIVVTPYLVKPVSASQIALPTDGYKGATDFQRIIGGQLFDGKSREPRPQPRMAPPVTAPAAPPPAGAPAGNAAARAASPGFSFN